MPRADNPLTQLVSMNGFQYVIDSRKWIKVIFCVIFRRLNVMIRFIFFSFSQSYANGNCGKITDEKKSVRPKRSSESIMLIFGRIFEESKRWFWTFHSKCLLLICCFFYKHEKRWKNIQHRTSSSDAKEWRLWWPCSLHLARCLSFTL